MNDIGTILRGHFRTCIYFQDICWQGVFFLEMAAILRLLDYLVLADRKSVV